MPVTHDLVEPSLITLLEVGDSFFVPTLKPQRYIRLMLAHAAELDIHIKCVAGIDKETDLYGVRVLRTPG